MDGYSEVYRDLTGKALLTYGAFSEGFKRHDVILDDETVNELFTKADEDCNGVISGSEWTVFCEGYPTLIDCLQHKVRDAAALSEYTAAEKDAQDSVARAIDNEKQAQALLQEATRATNEAESRCAFQLENAERANAIQKECEEAIQKTKASAEKGRETIVRVAQDMHAFKHQSALHHQASSEAERAVKILEIRAQEKVTELAGAASRLKAIEQMLADQQAVVEKAMTAANNIKAEVEVARSKIAAEKIQSEECEEKIKIKAEELARSEEDIMGLDQAHCQTALMLRDAEVALDRELLKTKEEDLKLKRCKEFEVSKSHAVTSAIQGIAAAEAHHRQVLLDKDAYVARRATEHIEELNLLHQELSLRRQRDSLVQKEALLRANFSAFTRGDGSHTPRRVSAARMRNDFSSPPCRP
eukprot:TRINITY_DN17937_c0_g1_i2.p1 TRINITY_DN17937_c0_g1~~TRINITY_DN17937_c0_g1_i2.p1  ORF type:complete len:415 (+),score=137.20 TRINITY_DN17937_c0_g1_i2:41-1285(+)